MRTIFCILIFYASYNMFAQSRISDFENFFSGNKNYNKPIKYILFNKSKGDTKKEIDSKVFFYMGGETFIFDSKINKIETCTLDDLKKYKLENPKVLTDNEYLYFNKKIIEFQKETKTKSPLFKAMPISRNHIYFKIIILEKINSKNLIKYEVDWVYSTF